MSIYPGRGLPAGLFAKQEPAIDMRSHREVYQTLVNAVLLGKEDRLVEMAAALPGKLAENKTAD